MSAEAGEVPQGELPPEAVEPTPPADSYRAFRELQRWLNLDDQGRSLGPPPSTARIASDPGTRIIRYDELSGKKPSADDISEE